MKTYTKQNIILKILIHLVFIFMCLLCIIPLLSILSVSLTEESNILDFGYKLIPKSISTKGYELIFKNPKSIINGYTVSIIVTFFGSLLGLLVASLIAYPLSRQDYVYRKRLSFYITFTMIFNGGMIPTYILITKYLHLKNSIFVLILPYVANVWLIFLLRIFFETIPKSLIESAKIDGASEFKIFAVIMIPLSKTGLATVGLFYALSYWNDWYLSLMYITKERLLPLQYLLSRMMNNLDFMSRSMSSMPSGVDVKSMPKESARMAMCIIAAGPMLFVFPFFQKHFVRGITIGAVKG